MGVGRTDEVSEAGGVMEYVLALSYGKDSLRCLGAIKELGLPLDRIVHREIWATDTIPADLPPMVEFKAKADKIIKQRYGIEVEYIHAPVSYEEKCYSKFEKGKRKGDIYGFPMLRGAWCNSRLKLSVLNQFNKQRIVQYVGICADEPERIKKLNGNKKSPAAEFGYTEQDCWKIAEELDLLSPIYKDSFRGGCWFCHNQSADQLRKLRKNYPEYWKLLLKWDNDSPITFKADGRTVHDFDRRFQLEDEGFITVDKPFRWSMLENPYIQLEF